VVGEFRVSDRHSCFLCWYTLYQLLEASSFLYLMGKLVQYAGKETEFGKSVLAPGIRASAKSSEAPPLQLVMFLLYYGSQSYI